MKKSLLLSLAIATCIGSAMAETPEPTIYPDASFQRISADGNVIVSQLYETVTIYNLADGTTQVFEPGDSYTISYSLGLGNCITADGSILLGSTKSDCDAAYLQNGEWHQLNVPDTEFTNLSNGITPDGSRICGSVGLSALTLEDALMQAPAYWDRNADGNGYGECHILPYPTKDLFGEKPQYVTAISISDDGKTIVGQMVFSSGMMIIPVVYTEDANGEWSYSLPTKDLFNPDHLEAVEDPGYGPEGPYYESYMTEEELAAYQTAMEEYNQAVTDYFQAGDFDAPFPEMPDYKNYMSEASMAKYTEAVNAYKIAYAEWEEKFDAYWDYMDGVMASSPTFTFNNVLLSLDGKYIVSTLETEDPNGSAGWGPPLHLYTPTTLDIATGELKKIETESTCLASGVAGDGVIFGYNGQRSVPMTGYVLRNGDVQTIQEYITAKVPAYGEWITKNLSHEVVVGYDEETWEEIIEEVLFTGMPISTPDMKIIAFWSTTPWDYDLTAQGVVFDMSDAGSVKAIVIGKNALTVGADGSVKVPEGFVSLDVYNVGGARVKSVNKPAGNVQLNLGNGVYIAKGTRADGTVSIVKISK